MSNFSHSDDILNSSNYLSYLIKRIKHHGLWCTFSSLYGNLRRFTVMSAIFKSLRILVSLIEKSAILLLLFSTLLILLPALLFALLIVTAACTVKYAGNHKKIRKMLHESERTIIYLTAAPLTKSSHFINTALDYSKAPENCVVILGRGNFVSFKWLKSNSILVRPDYFFILKTFYLQRCPQKNIFISIL